MKSVYIASDGPQRHKIGISESPSGRVRGLSSTMGRPLRLVDTHAVSDAAAVERMAHWLLADKRGLGEWFAVSAEQAQAAVVEAARRIASGEPAPNAKLYPERITLPLTTEMLKRADAAIEAGEDRVSLIRKALDRELTRRERKPKA